MHFYFYCCCCCCLSLLAALVDLSHASRELCHGSTLANSTCSTLSRRKRSLTFPKGSAFVLTITMLKAIQLKEPANWNLDLEFDMIWPIPAGINAPKPRVPKPLRKVSPYYGWQQQQQQQQQQQWRPHRRHRRELYANFELALDRQGLPGKLCVLRSVCEAKLILNPPGVSLIEDLLRVVFSYPSHRRASNDAYDYAHATQKDCDALYPCPVSLLDLLLNFHNDVSSYA